MNLFKSLVYSILSLQEKALKRKLSKTIGAKNNSKRKKYYTNGCFLSLESLADSEKQKIEDELELILKTCNYNPNEVLEYVKKHGTSVYYIKNSKALNSIGENEGFVYPTKGFKALYLSMLVQSKFAFKTQEMFILTKGEINKYYFIYHF